MDHFLPTSDLSACSWTGKADPPLALSLHENVCSDWHDLDFAEPCDKIGRDCIRMTSMLRSSVAHRQSGETVAICDHSASHFSRSADQS